MNQPATRSHPAEAVASQRAAAMDALRTQRFDLLIIGGGITGAGIARDAALRGLRAALVERADFASGTSSRSSRLIHGGLRYLEHGHLHLVFEASAERRRLLRLAPHLVRPLQFLWPLYRGARVPGWKVRAGLTLYDALSLFRNVGSHRALSSSEVVAREPGLRRDELEGGATYYDASTDDARLTLANAIGASEAGSTVVNHVAVIAIPGDGAANGVEVRDELTGERFVVAARVIVNAAGPWSDAIARLEDPRAIATLRGTKGVHVAVPRERIGNRGAVTLTSPIDGRVMFVLPEGAHTIIGTTDTPSDAAPDDVRATPDDVVYLLRSANALFPAAHLAEGDVVGAWAALRPLVAATYGQGPAAASREHALHWSPRRMLAVTGGKLTTYRVMAADAVREVVRALGGIAGRSPTLDLPLPGGDLTSVTEATREAEAVTGDAVVAETLVRAYGNHWRDVWRMAERDSELGAVVVPGLPYILAQMCYGVEHEMACTLGDLLLRRTRIAYETRDQGRGAAVSVARAVAPLLGWSHGAERTQIEAYGQEVERVFTIEGRPGA